MNVRFFWKRAVRNAGLCAVMLVILSHVASSQSNATERTYPQSKAKVEKALKALQPGMSGRLPVVEGFAIAGEHALSDYRRAYYQSTVQIEATASGGAVVRVNTKVTAWYADPVPSRSSYRVLTSNGRLEMDLLDQLAEQLGESAGVSGVATGLPSKNSADAEPRQTSSPEQKFPQVGNFSTSLTQSLAAQGREFPRSQPGTTGGGDSDSLRAEAASLEEVLKSQAHPGNIVAVKKSGTPLVEAPSLKAKTLFLASAQDEFEMLDFTPDWVHVRISGLSRGWIWRNSLELPGSMPETEAKPGAGPLAGADVFHVSREEIAPFPGDWQPLRGTSVKIISIEKSGETATDADLPLRLSYARFLLEKNYDELSRKPQELAGLVLIFDSADGGMIAATLSSLEQWKAGKLSDAALWRQCFFDPPEAFSPANPTGGQ